MKANKRPFVADLLQVSTQHKELESKQRPTKEA